MADPCAKIRAAREVARTRINRDNLWPPPEGHHRDFHQTALITSRKDDAARFSSDSLYSPPPLLLLLPFVLGSPREYTKNLHTSCRRKKKHKRGRHF